ncbi:MAG: YdcF family protein [Anaerolineae bacterium]|nr:YdcF family protein [Anaerolineae bacterium]
MTPLQKEGFHRRERGRLALVTLIAILGVCLTHALWLPWIGEFLVVADPVQTADAIVPLAGGDTRSVYAARLFQQGCAATYVATNMPLHAPGIRQSYGELVRQEAIWQGVPEEAIVVIPEEVETTYEEAQAVRALSAERGWRTVLVVTDPYHTRRARIIFHDVFADAGITLLMAPVEGHAYRPRTWWRDRDSLRETWTEYLKLALYALGYR